MSSPNTQPPALAPILTTTNNSDNPGWNDLPTFTGVKTFFGWLTAATFEIPLNDSQSVHMRAELPGGEDYYAVVLVDAARFVQLWRAPYSSHREVAILDERTWPSDYKYQEAVEGFSHGAENPVPLAEVSCDRLPHDIVEYRRRLFLFKSEVVVARKGEAVLGFTNGITRTIFLLANGAKQFPVRCELNSAKLLFELAGCGHQPLLLSSLRRQ